MRTTLGLLACLVSVGAAKAASLDVTVRSPTGAPVANAVVTIYPANGDFAPRATGETLSMAQKSIAFSPFVLVAPVGSMITFLNNDTVRHHVYSFSPAHRFELKLYGREEKPAQRFDKPGIVALGCNIHDKMAAYVDVVDTRFAAKTDSDGVAHVSGLPVGSAVLKVWHPFAKAPAGTLSRSVELSNAPTPVSVALDLRAAAPGKQDH